MAEQLSPGIQFTEPRVGPTNIAGVATAIGGMIGIAERGPINRPILIGSADEYTRIFGDRVSGSFLPGSAKAFFDNGGSSLYVNRVGHYTTITDPNTLDAIKATLQLKGDGGANDLLLEASSHGAHGNALSVTTVRQNQLITTSTQAVAASTTITSLTVASVRRLYVGAQFSVQPVGGGAAKLRAYVQRLDTGTNTVYFASATTSLVPIASGDEVYLEEWDLIVNRSGAFLERISQLAMSPLATNYFVNVINNNDPARQTYVALDNGLAPTAAVDPRPLQLQPTAGATTSGASPWYILTGQTLDIQFDVGGTQSFTFNATQGYVQGAGGTFAALNGTQLALRVNGGPIQTVTFTASAVDAATTAAEINAQVVGASATVVVGQVKITSDVYGTSSSINITTTNSAAGFAVSGLGTAGTGDAANLAAMQPSELVTKLSTLTNGTATIVGNTVKLTSNTLGTGSTAQVLGTSTATGFGYDNLVHTGTLGVSSNQPLAGGSDGTTPNDTDHIGSSSSKTGLFAFDPIEDVVLLSIPGRVSSAVQQALLTYVENRTDLFAIMSVNVGQTPQQAVTYVTNTANLFSEYGAIYYPWIKVSDPDTGLLSTVPSDGYTMGMYARTDDNRGVQKAPAGTPDGRLLNALGTERFLTQADKDLLYPNNINFIISLPGKGTVVFGSRTLSSGPFRQINVRRVFNFVKRSLREGTQFIIFEPNDANTRALVRKTVGAFLLRQWRRGLLKGSKASDAFFIICDETNNPPSVEIAGQLICRIGLAVSVPAEFITFELVQDTRALDAELNAAGVT